MLVSSPALKSSQSTTLQCYASQPLETGPAVCLSSYALMRIVCVTSQEITQYLQVICQTVVLFLYCVFVLFLIAPGAVGHLSFTDILDTSLKVSWKEPLEKNGILTGNY